MLKAISNAMVAMVSKLPAIISRILYKSGADIEKVGNRIVPIANEY